jgi:hypothetical protein
MNSSDIDAKSMDAFFAACASMTNGYRHTTFSYAAIRQEGELPLIQGRWVRRSDVRWSLVCYFKQRSSWRNPTASHFSRSRSLSRSIKLTASASSRAARAAEHSPMPRFISFPSSCSRRLVPDANSPRWHPNCQWLLGGPKLHRQRETSERKTHAAAPVDLSAGRTTDGAPPQITP